MEHNPPCCPTQPQTSSKVTTGCWHPLISQHPRLPNKKLAATHLLDDLQHHGLQVLVAIRAHAKVDLVRSVAGLERFRDAQDRIRRLLRHVSLPERR